MPTLVLDPYLTLAHEKSDLDWSWTEWGVNLDGLHSHALKEMRAGQFPAFGVEGAGGLQLNCGKCAPQTEGPHESFTTLYFRIPVAGVTFTDAFTTEYWSAYAGGQPITGRYFAVAMDNYASRFVTAAYAAVYESETYPSAYPGALRQAWMDSLAMSQEHTEAIEIGPYSVAESADAGPWATYHSPNIAAIINEVVGRPGWEAGNILCLVRGVYQPGAIAPFDYNPQQTGGGGQRGGVGCLGKDGDPTYIPKLTLTY